MSRRFNRAVPDAPSLALCIGVAICISCGGGLDEISTFPISCEGGYGPAECHPLNQVTFGVSAEHQFVLEWMPGMSDVPVRHSNCVVRNAGNWRCYDSVSVVRREMVRGHYSEARVREPGGANIFFLTRRQSGARTLGLARSDVPPTA